MANAAGSPRLGVVHQEQPPWANSTEKQFASLLDGYGIEWEHEPHRFPIAFDADGFPIEFFVPDFYLPETDEYIELTVLKQGLCTGKNRKLRLLRTLYPDVRCRIIFRRDYESLALKYGWESDPSFPELGVPRRRPGPPRVVVAS